MWIVYYLHGVLYHVALNVIILFDTFSAYADIAYENECFIDELDPDMVFSEVDKRLTEDVD